MAPFLSGYEYFQNTIEAGRRKMHQDEAWLLQNEIYSTAADNKKHAKPGDPPDLWYITGAGNLDDRVAVMRWQLLKLESGEIATDLTPRWHDLGPDQFALHYTRLADDFFRLKGARDQKAEEWEQCNKLTLKEVEESAADTLRANQAPSGTVVGAKGIAWSSHESRPVDLRAERDVLNLLLLKTDDKSDLRKELRRLAGKQGIEWEIIEGTAEINAQDDKHSDVEPRHSVSPYVTDEDLQFGDGVDDEDIDEEGNDNSAIEEEGDEVSVPGAWLATINDDTADVKTTNAETANEEELIEAMENLDLETST